MVSVLLEGLNAASLFDGFSCRFDMDFSDTPYRVLASHHSTVKVTFIYTTLCNLYFLSTNLFLPRLVSRASRFIEDIRSLPQFLMILRLKYFTDLYILKSKKMH